MSEKKRTLIASYTRKDFELQTFCTGGPGGQNQNRKQNGVRFVHLPTGLSAESRTFKSYQQNRKSAFEKLGEKIKEYHANCLKQDKIKLISNEIVRTYHEPDNRVTDHVSGLKQSYRHVLNDVSDMITARIDAS